MSGIIWPWERKKVQRELDSVEDMLESVFKPVDARPSFTSDLRKRLVRKEGPLAKASLTTLELVLLIGGAIAGVLVFFFTVVRSVANLLTGRRGRKAGAQTAPDKAANKPQGKLKTKKRAA
ncbi:MAG: hypothetical protein KIT70_08810 [Anaerolineales bacterium]|nr:MAG: hypothetical protein KIT70_08810 [Anaerolineales bacterium]